MYSFYVLRYTGMANNNGTITDCYVLADRADLMRVLVGLDVNPNWTEACTLDVFADGAVVHTMDLLATVEDVEPEAEDPFEQRTLDLAQIEIPALAGVTLPPGHPVIVNGEPLHYGCTAFYN